MKKTTMKRHISRVLAFVMLWALLPISITHTTTAAGQDPGQNDTDWLYMGPCYDTSGAVVTQDFVNLSYADIQTVYKPGGGPVSALVMEGDGSVAMAMTDPMTLTPGVYILEFDMWADVSGGNGISFDIVGDPQSALSSLAGESSRIGEALSGLGGQKQSSQNSGLFGQREPNQTGEEMKSAHRTHIGRQWSAMASGRVCPARATRTITRWLKTSSSD